MQLTLQAYHLKFRLNAVHARGDVCCLLIFCFANSLDSSQTVRHSDGIPGIIFRKKKMKIEKYLSGRQEKNISSKTSMKKFKVTAMPRIGLSFWHFLVVLTCFLKC